jgi:hypothetical protein
VNYLPAIQESLPPPYTSADDSVLTSMIGLAALELETFHEDLDRMRQTHWFDTAYRMLDARKLGALFNIVPLAWENLELYRQRLLALVVARLHGALGPNEIRQFIYDYLQGSERALGSTFVPGLQTVTLEEAFPQDQPPPSNPTEVLKKRPLFRSLSLAENLRRTQTSQTLADRNGRVPYLLRWTESNKGLDDTVAEFHISGLLQNRTVVPVLVNLTTGDLIGFAGRIPFGQTLSLSRPAPDGPLNDRRLEAMMEGIDVSSRVFSVENFQLGVPFSKQQQEPQPLLPRLRRGANDWIFLSVGMYDIRGLDRFFFSIAGQDLHEAVFDETRFDSSLFPSEPIAHLEMQWTETEPACFEVQVPRYVVIEPASAAPPSGRPYQQVGDSLVSSVADLRAAGVKAQVRFVPFTEEQRQKVTARVPWKILDAEAGPSGETRFVELGARFGESPLDQTRFE